MKAAEQKAFIWNTGWQPNIEGSYEWLPFLKIYTRKSIARNWLLMVWFYIALDWCVDKI